jgi:hypothetical protein
MGQSNRMIIDSSAHEKLLWLACPRLAVLFASTLLRKGHKMTTATRPSYRFSENATGNTSNEYGNHILRRGMGEIRKPSWNRTETVVRLLPQWDFEANRWSPFRNSPAPMDYGDWIRRYDAVRGFGESGITMLLFDPIANPAYDVQSNPCVILYRAINAAIDAKQCEPDWPALLKGGNNRRAVLGRHGPLYLSRCGIFRIKSKDMATAERSPLGLANSDPAFFLELPKTAGEKLISLTEERNEDFQGDPDDYKAAYTHGDIVSLDAGAYIHIFEEGADPRSEQSYQQGAAPRQLVVGSGGRGNYGGGGGGTQFKGYDLYIEPTWKGFSAQLNTPELERLIKSKQKPWDDCLQFYGHQEQAFLVQDGFPPSAILYAWRDHPEWIKDETRSKAVNRTSVMPGQPQSRDIQNTTYPPSQGGDFRGQAAGWAGIPAQKPLVVPPTGQVGPVQSEVVRGDTTTTTETTEAQDPNMKVGGWGQTAWDSAGKEEATAPSRDSVVPSGLPEASATTPGTDAVPSQAADREQRAMRALEEARKRAGRS